MRAGTALVAVLAFCAGGCAQVPVARVTPDLNAASGCERLYADVDRAVAQAGVADGAAARIQGFPYLRVDRFLASFANETEEQLEYFLGMRRRNRLIRIAVDYQNIFNLPEFFCNIKSP